MKRWFLSKTSIIVRIALTRRSCGGISLERAALQRRHDVGHEEFVDVVEDVLLALEILVHSRHRHLGGGGDLTDRRLGKSLCGDDLRGALEDLPPALVDDRLRELDWRRRARDPARSLLATRPGGRRHRPLLRPSTAICVCVTSATCCSSRNTTARHTETVRPTWSGRASARSVWPVPGPGNWSSIRVSS